MRYFLGLQIQRLSGELPCFMHLYWNRYHNITGWTVSVLARQSVFLSLLTSHPALSLYRNLPCLRPSLWLHNRSSPGQAITQFFIIAAELKAIRNTTLVLSFTDILAMFHCRRGLSCLTTTDYFRSLSGKHALHSQRTVILHFGTAANYP